jgi:hypothetical protein
MYGNSRPFGSFDVRDQKGQVRDMSASQFMNSHLPPYAILPYPMPNPSYHFHNQHPRVPGDIQEVTGKSGQKHLKETDAIQYLNQVSIPPGPP